MEPIIHNDPGDENDVPLRDALDLLERERECGDCGGKGGALGLRCVDCGGTGKVSS